MFRNSTEYNESIETHAATFAPFYVKTKEFVLKYVCNFLDSD
jgi:hypothetical protein